MSENIMKLSFTGLKTYTHCAERYRRQYIVKEPRPTWAPLVIGKAFHRGAQQMYLEKLQTGRHPSKSIIVDYAVAELKTIVDSTEIDWGKKQTPEKAKDVVAALGKAYHPKAESIEPLEVETEYESPLADGTSIRGRSDLIEKVDGQAVLSEIKTASQKPRQAIDLFSDQLTLYQIMHEATHKDKEIKEIKIHLVTKRKTPEVLFYSFPPKSKEEKVRLVGTVKAIAHDIREKVAGNGILPDGSWPMTFDLRLCSWCQFKSTCPGGMRL